MRGRLGGLKTLIQNENPCAYYVHCLAHQLQLSLVASLKGLVEVNWLLLHVGRVINEIASSNKRQDILREKQATNLASALSEGLLTTGRGLNQQLTLVRPGDTRWGSHYRTLLNLQKLYPSVIEVLQHLQIHDKSGEAKSLLRELQTFEFSFMLHVMVEVLGVTWDLSTTLQRREQDLLNALKLVEIAKSRLKSMRSDDGWNLIFQKVLVFCERCSLDVPDMNDLYVKVNTYARRAPIISSTHHYKIGCLFEIIDRFVEELDSRFDVASTELLSCLACLNPSSSFDAFDKKALLRMTKFYPSEFSGVDRVTLENQLENYIMDVRSDDRFNDLKSIGELSIKMVSTKKSLTYGFVYTLIKLALILPVATASVERSFSGMKFVKNELRNKICDQWLNDCLVTYVERDVFSTISDDVIIDHFQNMKTRRVQL